MKVRHLYASVFLYMYVNVSLSRKLVSHVFDTFINYANYMDNESLLKVLRLLSSHFATGLILKSPY